MSPTFLYTWLTSIVQFVCPDISRPGNLNKALLILNVRRKLIHKQFYNAMVSTINTRINILKVNKPGYLVVNILKVNILRYSTIVCEWQRSQESTSHTRPLHVALLHTDLVDFYCSLEDRLGCSHCRLRPFNESALALLAVRC